MADRQVYVVFGNPLTPEQDAEFNKWYDETHIPDVLKTPGVLSAQRYRVNQLEREAGTTPKYSYMTIYEYEGDANEVMAKIGAAVGSGAIRMDGAPMDMTKVNMAFWAPITEKIESELSARCPVPNVTSCSASRGRAAPVPRLPLMYSRDQVALLPHGYCRRVPCPPG